jgi:hypothetical protein
LLYKQEDETYVKIPIKYGLIITAGGIAWVVVTHLLITDPASPVHRVGAGIFFNILEIAGIYLAISSSKNRGGDFSFKNGIITGVATALVYAISFCVFFLVALLVLGNKLMAAEPGAENMPAWQLALGAFIGLFFGSLVFGLIYSTLISFFLARRRREAI